MKMSSSGLVVSVVMGSILVVGCTSQGDLRLAEKARIEANEIAKADLQAQLEARDQLIDQAKAEATATAKAELQAQIENIDLLTQRARIEGKAQAEAEIAAQDRNLALKAQQMEADLTARHLFYQATRGTYEGSIATERGEFKVRITLIPSLPPYTAARTRQLDEISADLNSLYFNGQVIQWNPANPLSAVGCRIENLRPDINKGDISIASSTCPNLYTLQIADADTEKEMTDSNGGVAPPRSEISRAVAHKLTEGRLANLTSIRGEIHPTTNAAIYPVTVNRVSR